MSLRNNHKIFRKWVILKQIKIFEINIILKLILVL